MDTARWRHCKHLPEPWQAGHRQAWFRQEGLQVNQDLSCRPQLTVKLIPSQSSNTSQRKGDQRLSGPSAGGAGNSLIEEQQIANTRGKHYFSSVFITVWPPLPPT